MRKITIISRDKLNDLALYSPSHNICYVGDYFDKNSLKLDGPTWKQAKDRMAEELERVLKTPLEYPLTVELHCHYSLAYLTGVKFRQKALNDTTDFFAVDITLVNANGSKFSLLCQANNDITGLTIDSYNVNGENSSSDNVALVLEVGIGKEALSSVQDYVNQTKIASKIICCKFNGEVNNEQFMAIHNAVVNAASNAKTIHLFGYSPVQLFFTLGAQWRHTKEVQLYEYSNQVYKPSFCVS